MNVKLIGITQPFLDISKSTFEQYEPSTKMTPEQLIAYCARVSSSNQSNPDTNKLLSYMVRNRHWSPFEMVNVVMEIETTRDIARQILRHRSFSFQEFSQRYAVVDDSSFTFKEVRTQDPKNRQNSNQTDDVELVADWDGIQETVMHTCIELYKEALAKGIAKEVARSILPEGLTMSRMYMSGTLRSWIHYVDLRTGNGTQKEHREIAEACKAILMKEFLFLEALWGEDGYIPFA